MKSLRFVSSALVLGAVVISLAGCGKTAETIAPAIVLDTTPPDAPTSLVGSYDAAGNRDYLNWNASTAADLAGYEVWQYESDPSLGGTGHQIASLDGSAVSLALPPTGEAQTAWYRVRAIDEAGNKSSYSSSASTELHAWEGTNGLPGGRGLDSGN